MLDAFPELWPCCARLFDDWFHTVREPPPPYIVFGGTYETSLEVLLALPRDTTGRRELLQRHLDFGKRMLASEDPEVQFLGVGALGTLDRHPVGTAIVRELGDLESWRSFAAYRRHDRVRDRSDEIIGLWGVREAPSPLLPDVPPPEIPGISHLADYRALNSLSEAKEAIDGVVLLTSYVTTFFYVVCPASAVACDEAPLQRAAQELAQRMGDDEDPSGKPGVQYRRIPKGERVWNMDVGAHRQTRLGDDPWIADDLREVRTTLLELLAGGIDRWPGSE
jgi:hypothetical protein